MNEAFLCWIWEVIHIISILLLLRFSLLLMPMWAMILSLLATINDLVDLAGPVSHHRRSAIAWSIVLFELSKKTFLNASLIQKNVQVSWLFKVWSIAICSRSRIYKTKSAFAFEFCFHFTENDFFFLRYLFSINPIGCPNTMQLVRLCDKLLSCKIVLFISTCGGFLFLRFFVLKDKSLIYCVSRWTCHFVHVLTTPSVLSQVSLLVQSIVRWLVDIGDPC